MTRPSAGNTQLDMVATIVMLCIAAVLVVWAISSYSSSSRRTSNIVELPLPSDSVSLHGAMVDGCESARLIVITYSDFQCPECGVFAQEVLPSLRKGYVEQCKVRVAFRNLPVAAKHQFAVSAAETAACAGVQGRFWEMHDLIFAHQDSLDPSSLLTMARALRLDQAALGACLEGRSVLPQIRLDAGEAVTMGVSVTPTVLVGLLDRNNKVKVLRRLTGRVSPRLEGILDELLRTEEGTGR